MAGFNENCSYIFCTKSKRNILCNVNALWMYKRNIMHIVHCTMYMSVLCTSMYIVQHIMYIVYHACVYACTHV